MYSVLLYLTQMILSLAILVKEITFLMMIMFSMIYYDFKFNRNKKIIIKI